MDECYTAVELHQFEYKWTIRDFNLHLECAEDEKNKITLKSSSFTVDDNNSKSSKTTWHLKLYIYGHENDSKDYIGIFAYLENINDNNNNQTMEIFASQTYFLVNCEGKKIKLGRVRMHKYIPITLNNWGCDKIYEKKKLLENSDIYLPNHELKIICEINVMGDDKTSTKNCHYMPKVIANNFSNDIAKLYRNEKFSDVMLILDDEKIPAHKTILAARSSVFAEIFQEEFNEDTNHMNNEVIIDDFNPETFKAMLQYIYTNEVKDLDRMALNLLWTANKYELEDLRRMCEVSLCKKVVIDNAADYLIYANLFHGGILMKYCRNFIHAHIEDVMNTTKYEAMERRYPELVADLYRTSIMGNRRKKLRISEEK